MYNLAGDQMPIYRFVCRQCNSEEEILMKFTDRVPRCCHCGGELIKQVSRVSVKRAQGSASACSGCTADSCSSCSG